MAKPLRYGPTIGVRLPLELHDAVIDMAGPDGPGPWIRDLITDYVETLAGIEPRDPAPETVAKAKARGRFVPIDGETASNDPAICEHPKSTATAGATGTTLRTCNTCGAQRYGNGPWQP